MEEAGLLPSLYEKVLIPNEVHRELQRARTPQAVRSWAYALPDRCEVQTPVLAPDPSLGALDEGERQVICLALDLGIDTLLMDDWEGRREAERALLPS